MPLLRLSEAFDHPDWLFELKHEGMTTAIGLWISLRDRPPATTSGMKASPSKPRAARSSTVKAVPLS
jgi:hypothetical protein